MTKYAVAARINKLVATARDLMAKKEYICSECGFAAKSAAGLRGHRQFKHGIPPSLPLLPSERRDRLVTRSELEQLLGLAGEQEQPSSLKGVGLDLRDRSDAITKLRQWTKDLDRRIKQLEIDAAIVKRLAQLEQRIRQLPEEVGKLQQRMDKLEADQIGLTEAAVGDAFLLILALNAHTHSDDTGRVTFILEPELAQRLANGLKQAKEWACLDTEREHLRKAVEAVAQMFVRTAKRR